ncbi:MAG TPA: ABC transporter ATP-binding protein/permease [Alphaproteobacteria bacterium]|nr:ABC transporter ATP-binding protein/permease [Alphaproteobacteria bacterium]
MTPSHPSKKAARNRLGDRRTLAALLPYLWPRPGVEQWAEMRVRVVLALTLLAGAKIVNIYVPILYKRAVDALSPEHGGAIVVPVMIIVAYAVARVLNVAFSELRDAVFAKVGQRAIRTVALTTFRHLHALALRFHLERQTGGLSRAIERGTKGIETLLSYMLFSILPTLVEIALVCGVLWGFYDVWFAAVTFFTIIGYIAFTMMVTEWRIKFRHAMNETDNEASTKAIDSLLNYETVKYFGNEEHEARRFDNALQRYERAAVKSEGSLSLLNIGQGLIIALGLIAIMVMAGNGVKAGHMTVGDFVLCNTYLIQLYQPLNFLGFVYRSVKQSLVDMAQMFQLLTVDAEVKDKPGAPPLEVSAGVVRFEHVAFGYDPRRRILHDLSFTVPAGKTVAVVGPTGSGKSTISRLLFRFYDVDGGRITVDGQDIREVTQKSVRAAIGIVPQDTVLFNDTVYYNIAYGRPGATREEVEEAARLARIHDFLLTLPDGYKTMVGERGLKLSGGEKQRVAIARTILKRPKILLFDEATSALDTHTEKEIQASLREVSADHTTIVIAHRLSTVVDADEILVLVEGRVVERGTHRALLDRRGRYHAMWTRQQQEEAGAAEPELRVPAAAGGIGA